MLRRVLITIVPLVAVGAAVLVLLFAHYKANEHATPGPRGTSP